jgi:putative ABC transport system ATP-binding protein
VKALRLNGVSKTYDRQRAAPVRALRSVELDVEPGEFVAITGPSGCGKSTMLNIAAGLEVADEGLITIADERIDGRHEADRAVLRRTHVGIVFQFHNLIDELSVTENIALPAVLGGCKRPAALDRARDLLDFLGLGGRGRSSPAVLSGGQRQRLAIARALVNTPTLLLADEPTGALDSTAAEEIGDLFQRLNDDGQTIVLVTHDARLAATATRVVRMADGRLIGAA